MPRRTRRLSKADIYHVSIRGVGRVLIFEDDDDRRRFLDYLSRMLGDTGGELLAWCLMSNHAHMLFRLDLETLSEGMRRFESSYATYFNKRHDRVGHLFQGRFDSEPINDDTYLLTVVQYIHFNPEKANVAPMARYRWSSYGEYLGRSGLCNTDFVLGIVGGVEGFKRLHDAPTVGLTAIRDGRRLGKMNDEDVRAAVVEAIGEEKLRSLPSMDRSARDPLIAQMLRAGITVRQVERITGVSRGVIQRISAET